MSARVDPIAWLSQQSPFVIFAAIQSAYDSGGAGVPDDNTSSDAFHAARNDMVATSPSNLREFQILAEWVAFNEDACMTDDDKALLSKRLAALVRASPD